MLFVADLSESLRNSMTLSLHPKCLAPIKQIHFLQWFLYVKIVMSKDSIRLTLKSKILSISIISNLKEYAAGIKPDHFGF